MYKVQPYNDEHGNEQYHLLDCNNNYVIVPEVESFLNYANLRNFSPFTIQAYVYDLLHFYNYCESIGVNPLHLETGKNMMDIFTGFSHYLLTRKNGSKAISFDKPARASSTINRIMSTIYNFYRYLSYANLAKLPEVFKATRIERNHNFLSELVHAKLQHYNLFRLQSPQKPIKYVTRIQYDELISACCSMRDKLIVALLFEGGLRVGEVCGLHLEDLCDIDHGIVHIIPRDNNVNGARVKNHAKGSIYLPPDITSMMIEYVSNKTDGSDYLFTSTKGYKAGSPLTTHNITRLFNELSKRTGITAHPHMLRHGFAVEKIEDNWQLHEVQSYLRHKDPTSTAIYAEFTDTAKIKRMQKFYKQHGFYITADDIKDLEFVLEDDDEIEQEDKDYVKR